MEENNIIEQKDKIKYMKMAILQAKKAGQLDEVPIGCVIVKGGKVLAKGYNKKHTKKNPLCHAEIIAINKAVKKIGDWRLEGCSLFVTLEPCIMCSGAIVSSRMQQVFFGAFEQKGGGCKSLYNLMENNGLNHTVKCEGGILQEECSHLINDYFKQKRKKKQKEQ